MWAAAQLRHRAPGIYYAPLLWGTSDGVVPFRRFWAEYAVMGTHLAHERWERMAAYSLALAGEQGQTVREQTQGVAFPSFTEGERDG